MLKPSLIHPLSHIEAASVGAGGNFFGPSAGSSKQAQPLEPLHPNRSREGWHSGASAPRE